MKFLIFLLIFCALALADGYQSEARFDWDHTNFMWVYSIIAPSNLTRILISLFIVWYIFQLPERTNLWKTSIRWQLHICPRNCRPPKLFLHWRCSGLFVYPGDTSRQRNSSKPSMNLQHTWTNFSDFSSLELPLGDLTGSSISQVAFLDYLRNATSNFGTSLSPELMFRRSSK